MARHLGDSRPGEDHFFFSQQDSSEVLGGGSFSVEIMGSCIPDITVTLGVAAYKDNSIVTEYPFYSYV